ncbi:MAG: hypothetical protein AB7G37_13245 [Solirubrobacteraceae bacterium]
MAGVGLALGAGGIGAAVALGAPPSRDASVLGPEWAANYAAGMQQRAEAARAPGGPAGPVRSSKVEIERSHRANEGRIGPVGVARLAGESAPVQTRQTARIS